MWLSHKIYKMDVYRRKFKAIDRWCWKMYRVTDTAAPHIGRRTIPQLTVLYEASYMRQGYKLLFFLMHLFLYKIVMSLYMRRYHDFPVDQRQSCVRCLSLTTYNFFGKKVKLYRNTLLFLHLQVHNQQCGAFFLFFVVVHFFVSCIKHLIPIASYRTMFLYEEGTHIAVRSFLQ